MKFSACFVRADGDFFGEDNIARIELTNHMHDGDSGFGFTIANGGLDAGGSAVFRENRCVEVDDRFFGSFSDGFSDDLAVGHDDSEVRTQRF